MTPTRRQATPGAIVVTVRGAARSPRQGFSEQRRRRQAHRRRVAATVASTGILAATALAGATPAAAAPGDILEAEGAFLEGNVLGLDIGALLDPAEAGFPSEPGTDTGDVSLPDVTVPVVGLPLFSEAGGDGLLALSGITQEATVTGPTDPATASAGVANAEINVTEWVDDV